MRHSEKSWRRLPNLPAKLTQWDRANKEIFDGRVEKAQQETYGIGQQIATWTYFRLSVVPESTLADLRRIGLSLLQLVSMRVYMDGGASLQRIVDDAQTLVKELNANVESFLQFDRWRVLCAPPFALGRLRATAARGVLAPAVR